MTYTTAQSLLTIVLLSVSIAMVHANDQPIVAFPGAEGFGATATGGRGGRVLSVYQYQ